MPDAPLLANIDETGKRKRLYVGLFAFDVALLGAVLLIVFGLPKWWRLSVFVPFVIGLLCIFEAKSSC